MSERGFNRTEYAGSTSRGQGRRRAAVPATVLAGKAVALPGGLLRQSAALTEPEHHDRTSR